MWQKCLGGSSGESANSIQQTSDGGYIVAGYTLSNDGDVAGNHGGSDAWVIKLNADGSGDEPGGGGGGGCNAGLGAGALIWATGLLVGLTKGKRR